MIEYIISGFLYICLNFALTFLTLGVVYDFFPNFYRAINKNAMIRLLVLLILILAFPLVFVIEVILLIFFAFFLFMVYLYNFIAKGELD